MKEWTRWRPLFRFEPPEQEAMHWAARGLRDLLIRRALDDGRVGTREILTTIYRGDDLFERSVDALLADGFLVTGEGGMLFVRNLPDYLVPPQTGEAGDEADGTEPSEPAPANESPEERRRRLARARAKAARSRAKQRGDSPEERDDQRDAGAHGARTVSVTERDGVTPSPSPLASPLPLPDIQKNQTERADADSGARPRQRDEVRTDSVTERDTPSVRVTRDVSVTRPTTRDDALLEPICARAERVARDPHLASYLEPHRWPEVARVSDALCKAMGRPLRVLASYDRDSGVRAVVGLYAAGYLPADLERAARLVPTTDWWTRDGARRGLSSLTPEVVDRALHDPADGRVSNLVRKARADAERGGPPTPLGAELTRLVSGGNDA